MKRHRVQSLSVALLALTTAACAGSARSQTPTPGGERGAREEGIRPYSQVITSAAQTDEGMFDVHRIDDKLFFEIPAALLGEELLLVTRIARTAQNLGYGGEEANTHVVRWERQGNDVLLRVVSYENVAADSLPIYEAVRNSNLEPIIRSFPIAAMAPADGGVVIDVTELYESDVPALGLPGNDRSRHEVRRLDTDRSYIQWAKSYPRNVEVRHVLTYEAAEPPSNAATNTITVEMNQSMVRLPEDPMTPRPYDWRVGYFSVNQTDYGEDSQEATRKRYITRWRLEPGDTAAFRRGELVDGSSTTMTRWCTRTATIT